MKFVQRSGSEQDVEIGEHVSVMLAAVTSEMCGIDGECGGCLDCATCHVYVEETQTALLAPPGDEELELLSNVFAPRKPGSRPSCQLKLPASIDQLVVVIPELQS